MLKDSVDSRMAPLSSNELAIAAAALYCIIVAEKKERRRRIRADMHSYTKLYVAKGRKTKLNDTMNGQLLHEGTQRHSKAERHNGYTLL